MDDVGSESPVEVLRRWETFGGVWEVVHDGPTGVVISLRRCDGGEEVSRMVTDDPDVRSYLERPDRP